MLENVLFQVTQETLETGLRGVPVGYCVTSKVDPEKGLFYCDHAIAELTHWEPEQVIFLLFYGYTGSGGEVRDFKQKLIQRAPLSKEVIDQIEKLPRAHDPMASYAASLLLLGMLEGKRNYEEDALDVIAKIPELTARVINHQAGWNGLRPPVASQAQMGYMQNFFQMLQLPERPSDKLPEILKLFNILHYDHGGGNLSAFVGKAVASGLADQYASLSAAMNALSGPRHGRANQESLALVAEMVEQLGTAASEKQVEERLREKLDKQELLYGFGHAVLRVEDPRATIQYALAERYFPDDPLVRMALKMRKAGVKVLKENPKISNPYPNVDAISGTLLSAAGFPYPHYYTLLFGLARSVGISIQILYERCYARQGRGTPIVRPKYFYKPRVL